MNKVILLGRLTADPEVYQGDSFTSCTFTLAINRTYKNKDGERVADFINCQLTRNTDLFIKSCKKGTMVSLVGEWRTGSYVNKEGNNVYTNTCFVNEYYLLPRSTNGSDNTPSNYVMPSRTNTTPITYAPMKDSNIDNIGTPIKIEETNEPEQITIPQAFDSDVDMSDEFPW